LRPLRIQFFRLSPELPGDLRHSPGDGETADGGRGKSGIGKTGNSDAVTITQLIEIYGAEGARFLWSNFDHQTIDDCVIETIEWRKPEEERKKEEDQEHYQEFLAKNPNFAENFFEEALRKRRESRGIKTQELPTTL